MPISFSVTGRDWKPQEVNPKYKWRKEDGIFKVVFIEEEPILELRRRAQRYCVYVLPKTTARYCQHYNGSHKASLIRFTANTETIYDLFDDILQSLRSFAQLIHIQAQLRENEQMDGLSGLLNKISNNELIHYPPKLHGLRLESSDTTFRDIFSRLRNNNNNNNSDANLFKVHVERYGADRGPAGNLRDTKEKRIIWIVTKKSLLSQARQDMLNNPSSYEAYVLYGQEVEQNKEMVVCLQEGIDALNRVDWIYTYRSPTSSSSTPPPPISVLVAEFQKAAEAINLTDPKQLNSILS